MVDSGKGCRILVTFAGVHSTDMTVEMNDVDSVQMYGAAKIIEREANRAMLQMEMARDNTDRREVIEVARAMPTLVKGS